MGKGGDKIFSMDNETSQIKDTFNNSDASRVGKLQGSEDTYWHQFEDKAIKGKDPVAQAVVILRNELKEDIKELKKLKEGLSQYKDNLRKVEQILIGIAFVILIAWISSFLFVFYDLIKEKDLFLKYDKMYENYNQRYYLQYIFLFLQ